MNTKYSFYDFIHSFIHSFSTDWMELHPWINDTMLVSQPEKLKRHCHKGGARAKINGKLGAWDAVWAHTECIRFSFPDILYRCNSRDTMSQRRSMTQNLSLHLHPTWKPMHPKGVFAPAAWWHQMPDTRWSSSIYIQPMVTNAAGWISQAKGGPLSFQHKLRDSAGFQAQCNWCIQGVACLVAEALAKWHPGAHTQLLAWAT